MPRKKRSELWGMNIVAEKGRDASDGLMRGMAQRGVWPRALCVLSAPPERAKGRTRQGNAARECAIAQLYSIQEALVGQVL